MKRILSLLIIMILALTVVGCQKQNQDNQDNTPVSYRDQLEKIVDKEKNHELYYNGNNGYGHVLHITDVQKNEELTIVKMDGVLMDIIGREPGQRTFQVDYVVDTNSIREIIHNNDIYKTIGNMETVNSIIPNQIILQGPLEKGNLWFQPFAYNEKEYTAQTTITNVTKNEEGKTIYTTETVVENIEGFYQNTYKETRTYEEGKGLVSFQNNQPIVSGGNLAAEGENEGLFEYGLSSVREIESQK